MDYSGYLSPFSFRYGSKNLRDLWGEENKRVLWRKMWFSIAKAYHNIDSSFIDDLELTSIEKNIYNTDLERSLEIENEIKHDLMAELLCFSEQTESKNLHLGATSTDIEDNVDVFRVRESIKEIQNKLKTILESLCFICDKNSNVPTLGFTHLQPAEPTTIGYRFSIYLQDLYDDFLDLKNFKMKYKGIKGAVGTSASYLFVLNQINNSNVNIEHDVLKFFDPSFTDEECYDITTQVYSRKQDFKLLNILSSIGLTLSKFALDVRVLQNLGEVSEPFSNKQVGSSAMPFKKNPILSEKINSIARILSSYPKIAWDNGANSILERTLDDSANRRIILPEAFLSCDEILESTLKILKGIRINRSKSLKEYGEFSNLEKILLFVCVNGGDRQLIHEVLRQHSLSHREDNSEPLLDKILLDERIKKFIKDPENLKLELLKSHIGDVTARVQKLVDKVKNEI